MEKQELEPKDELQKKQIDFLSKQVKYLGLGQDPKIKEDILKGINSTEKGFTVKVSSDKASQGNKVEFNLNFNKSEQGGVFLNSYKAVLTTAQNEERSHTFRVQKENNVTAKEAINLLEGRAVKIVRDITNQETQQPSKEPAFIKLKLNDEKTQYGNYKLEQYNKNYNVDVDKIMEKSKLVFASEQDKEFTKKSLEKGNITKVTFVDEKNNQNKQGFAVLNPQWKNLNLYDENMNRLINKNQVKIMQEENNVEKNRAKEQSITRSL